MSDKWYKKRLNTTKVFRERTDFDLKYFQDTILANRRSGKSTEIAFSLITEAYRNREQWIEIIDHWPAPNKYLAVKITQILQREGFEYEMQTRGGRYWLRIPKVGFLDKEECIKEGLWDEENKTKRTRSRKKRQGPSKLSDT